LGPSAEARPPHPPEAGLPAVGATGKD